MENEGFIKQHTCFGNKRLGFFPGNFKHVQDMNLLFLLLNSNMHRNGPDL